MKITDQTSELERRNTQGYPKKLSEVYPPGAGLLMFSCFLGWYRRHLQHDGKEAKGALEFLALARVRWQYLLRGPSVYVCTYTSIYHKLLKTKGEPQLK